MSFLYPYNISIQRTVEAFSATDGATQTLETIAASVPCSIQLKRDKGFGAPVAFPAGTNTSAPMPALMVFIPASSGLGQGAIRPDDMITDLATGDQYKADFPSWSPLGWKVACVPYRPDA